MKEFNLNLHQCKLPGQFWVEGSPLTDAEVRVSKKGTSQITLNGKEFNVTGTTRITGRGRMHGKVYFLKSDRWEEVVDKLREAYSNGNSDEERDRYAKEKFGMGLDELRRKRVEEGIEIMEKPR